MQKFLFWRLAPLLLAPDCKSLSSRDSWASRCLLSACLPPLQVNFRIGTWLTPPPTAPHLESRQFPRHFCLVFDLTFTFWLLVFRFLSANYHHFGQMPEAICLGLSFSAKVSMVARGLKNGEESLGLAAHYVAIKIICCYGGTLTAIFIAKKQSNFNVRRRILIEK